MIGEKKGICFDLSEEQLPGGLYLIFGRRAALLSSGENLAVGGGEGVLPPWNP
jgi:hypothetical protein